MSDVTIQNRYSRQIVFEPIGPEGQQRLSQSRVTLVGCGALGGMSAELLVRAGVGFIRIIDRDIVELVNLQRQTLYTEADAAQGQPKATAAAKYLRRLNSDVDIEPIIADVVKTNIENFIKGADLILDGVDNLQTRFLINDAAIKHKIPYIFASCLAARAMSMTILPPGRPCLRCVLEQPPAPGEIETAETAGILGPTAALLAAFEAGEAMKLLTGNLPAVNRGLTTFDLWGNRIHTVSLAGMEKGCPCCGEGQFDYLEGGDNFHMIQCVGRDTIQIHPPTPDIKLDLDALAQRLHDAGRLIRTDYTLKLTVANHELTFFTDGRALITGANSAEQAHALYTRFVGH
ncbi:MAG: ThiF family adenylyltransferase [Sedimentisphaerales bacterium]|nr:ThiF family adenylyltransferase [Sedimentisphaerales bacterium]